MNIGILQPAGIAGKIIETALADPDAAELFTPVIYSREHGNEKNVSHDLKFGNIDAVVVAPGSAKEFAFEGSLTVWADSRLRLAAISAEADSETLRAAIRKAWDVARRDFLVSLPRVAVVMAEAPQTAEDGTPADPVTETIHSLAEDSVCVYGPYSKAQYLDEGQYLHFDITLCLGHDVGQEILHTVTDDTRTRYPAAIPMVMTMTDYAADYAFGEDDLEEPAQALREAIYTAQTIVRNRRVYDEAHADPLLKLYHERRDDSEKVRFAVGRKKPQQA